MEPLNPEGPGGLPLIPPSLRHLAHEAATAVREGRGADVRRAIDAESPAAVLPAGTEVPPPAVPPRFRVAAFDTFVVPSRDGHPAVDATASPHRSLQAALRATQAFVERVASGEPTMLALVGAQGTGKSHLLYAAARALHARGLRVTAHAWHTLADELRYGRRTSGAHGLEGARVESWQVRESLRSARILLLDEVRPTAGTDFDDTELAKLSCHAYDHEVSVLLTSNVAPLERVMGPAAADRYTQVVVDAPSWRQRRDVAA